MNVTFLKSVVYLKTVEENWIAKDNANDYHISNTQRNKLICSFYMDSETGQLVTISATLKAEGRS